MNKYEMAEKLALLLDCAESGIQIKAVEDIDENYKVFKGMYYVLSDGRVWSTYKKNFLTPYDNGHGYLYVKFWDNERQINKRLNVLIADAFVEKPEEWQPNWDAAHKDDNPYNNDSNNLEWQPRSKNLRTEHWREANRVKLFTPIRCVETGEVFPSQAAAARAIDRHKYGINSCLMGKQKTCGGYHWERVSPEEAES